MTTRSHPPQKLITFAMVGSLRFKRISSRTQISSNRSHTKCASRILESLSYIMANFWICSSASHFDILPIKDMKKRDENQDIIRWPPFVLKGPSHRVCWRATEFPITDQFNSCLTFQITQRISFSDSSFAKNDHFLNVSGRNLSCKNRPHFVLMSAPPLTPFTCLSERIRFNPHFPTSFSIPCLLILFPCHISHHHSVSQRRLSQAHFWGNHSPPIFRQIVRLSAEAVSYSGSDVTLIRMNDAVAFAFFHSDEGMSFILSWSHDWSCYRSYFSSDMSPRSSYLFHRSMVLHVSPSVSSFLLPLTFLVNALSRNYAL